MYEALGHRRWVIPEGYLPGWSHGPQPEMLSHGTLCVLNTGSTPAHVSITIFFDDREPLGPFRVEVDPRRTRHIRFNDLDNPEPLPRDTDFASVLESDVPVVVQHTRLDSRQADNALMTTLAYAAG